MKRWSLNLLYVAAWMVMIPVIVWRRMVAGRSFGNPLQRVIGWVPCIVNKAPVVWLHAVSVGEVNQLDAIIRQLGQLKPDWRFVISTTTATGMGLVKRKHPDITSFFFPIDFSWAMNNVMRRIKPCMVVLTELEVWPNLIDIANRQKVPVVVINGRLSEKSFSGYQRLAFLVRPVFSRLSMVIAQDDVYARRFVALGADPAHVHVAGSIKYDNAARQAATIQSYRDSQTTEFREFENWMGLRSDEILLVAGSTQEPEEMMIARVWRELHQEFPHLRLAIVPRHPHRSAGIARDLQSMEIPVLRRSTSDPDGEPARSDLNRPSPVILVDTVGELGYCWDLSEVAFVGGSFGNRGGQNMLEPAAAGNAVCFGPNTRNFATIVADMKNADACCAVENEQTLALFIRSCLANPDLRRERAEKARCFVRAGTGATLRTVQLLATIGPVPSRQEHFMEDKVA